MTDIKLLTEAEALKLFYDNKYSAFLKALRERGMIAPEPEPEPVDPLLIEAREICVECFTSRNYSQTVIDRLADNDTVVQIALTALRRNLELAERPTLTHLQAALLLCNAMADAEVENVSSYDLGPHGQTTKGRKIAAALVERLK